GKAGGRYAGKSAAERHAERRRRFLDAALQLFGDSPGYRATTVALLCERAGLSTRQFYEEFAALEDVLAALHLQVNDWAEAAVQQAMAATAGLPALERMAAVFRAYATDVTSDPRRLRIAFTEIVGISPRMDEQRLSRRSRWVELIRTEAEAAAARGEVPHRNYALAATAFIGSVNGLLHDWCAGWVDAGLDEVVNELTRALFLLTEEPATCRPPAEAARPEPTTSRTAHPEPNPSRTAQPKPGRSGTVHPEPARSGTGHPEPGRSGTGQPEAGRPTTGRSQSGHPEAGHSVPGHSEARHPKADRPEHDGPEAEHP
ncbi:TetR family transcriptional regulator, partial [Nonomuraea sp. NN258]|uniref:TetR/AcrR family transcriptional regulator n=1 Tax=Nonomuraea antri TaxID=2730852 RepID=UPI001567FB2C